MRELLHDLCFQQREKEHQGLVNVGMGSQADDVLEFTDTWIPGSMGIISDCHYVLEHA